MNISPKTIVSFIVTVTLSIFVTNFGGLLINQFPENPYLGISLVILGFLLIYYWGYLNQIKLNKDKGD